MAADTNIIVYFVVGDTLYSLLVRNVDQIYHHFTALYVHMEYDKTPSLSG